GMSNMAQVEENIAIAESAKAHAFSPAELKTIEAVENYFSENLKIPCTACAYCLPCPMGIDIPQNFTYYNKYHLLDSDISRKQSWFFYQCQMPLKARAINCTACGQCETKCPQNLAIIDEMKNVASWAQNLDNSHSIG
ncbi:MAG: 4Fe-4S dicluster domain-containing protein, partial [Candidatus Adiutrix sp.]